MLKRYPLKIRHYPCVLIIFTDLARTKKYRILKEGYSLKRYSVILTAVLCSFGSFLCSCFAINDGQ